MVTSQSGSIVDTSAKKERIYDLMKILPYSVWTLFSFSTWDEDEEKVLKPALKRLGYTDIYFFSGESDSFGPLTRIVRMTKKNGQRITAVYG